MKDTRASAAHGYSGIGGGGTGATVSGPEGIGGKTWKFEYHGFFRAPMRVGVGERDNPLPGQSKTTFHSPIVPDDQYLSWQHTPHNQRDWAEMFFSLGTPYAKGTVAITGFNFADAAWNDSSAVFGISQAWVTLTPDLGYENVRLSAKVGSFWNAYGRPGKYDGGAYDTYLFGRTHTMGETVRLELDKGRMTLYAEDGVGTKRPDPSIYNRARFTMLHHIHGGLLFARKLEFGVHHMYAFASEELRFGQANVGPNQPDGSLQVFGPEVRYDAGPFGYLYLGYSHLIAKDAVTVAPAIEVLHSYGGGEFDLGITGNYLDSRGCGTSGNPACSGGNGALDSILGQYEFSLTNFTQGTSGGPRFWGEGQDLYLTLYGMYNKVTSNDTRQDGISKVKYGGDLAFHALPWLTAAVRFDQVKPNSRIPEQSFSIFSPRLEFHSRWVTHEQITLQYSRYIYSQRTCAPPASPADRVYQPGEEQCVQPPSAPVLPEGFGATDVNQNPNTRGAPTTRPDLNVFRIEASMWW